MINGRISQRRIRDVRRREISKLKICIKNPWQKVWGKTIIQYTAVERELSLHRDDLFVSPYQRKASVEPARACTGFDGGFEVVEAIRSLPNCVITGNSKYKRWRSVSNGSLSAARQSCCTHTSGVWRRPCEKPCRVSFAPVDVSWSYWSSKPVGGRAVEGMLIQRLWWEMPQGIDFRTRVQFPPGP